MGQRVLIPDAGRFNRPDPVGLVEPATGKINMEMLLNPQRQNRYVYGLNNPYRYVDRDGKFAIRAVYVRATDTYKFRATFRQAPKSVVGKTLGYLGKPVKTVYTAATKGTSAIGGNPVSYTKQGLGFKQEWSEASHDSIFQGMLSNQEKNDLSRGFTSESDMKAILQKFSGNTGYGKMNYPKPSDMIGTAKENFDNSALGSVYKPKKEKK